MVAIFAMLIYTTGWLAGCSGIGFIVAMCPLIRYCHLRMRDIRFAMMKVTDKRVSLVSEAVNGIKLIKQYAWEIPVSNAIQEQRVDECQLLFRMLLYIVCG